MADVNNLGMFILAGWLLNLTPGPDVLYIVNNALRAGVRAGMVAALGITAGCFVHILAAALGVSALMAASSTAFTALKWLGAAYLFYVGLKLLWSSAVPALPVHAGHAAPVAAPRLKRVFFNGFMTNALNPKVALFFLAFVPQFIAPGAAHPAWTFLLLGLLFNLNAVPINLGYAWVAAWAAGRVQTVRRAMHWLDRLAGAMFLGFGVKLALSDAPAP